MSIFTYALDAAVQIFQTMKGESAMPNDAYYIVCPYYGKTLGNMIFCSAFSADQKIKTNEAVFKQVFESRDERNKCIEKYCSVFDYHNCRIATLNDYLFGEK